MKEILTSIRRTPYQSVASFLILFFTLFLSLFFFNLVSFFHGFLSFVETQPQVTVYFQSETKEAYISQVKQNLEQTGRVTSVKYVSKEEAFNIYKNYEKNNPLLLEMVSAEILPASLEVKAEKPEYLAEIASSLKKQPGIDEVVFQKDIVDKLLTFTKVVRRISLFILILLLAITFIVLMTTTAFKISLKKDEIELLRLLGAGTFYIRKPFFYEGMIFGLTSGTLAFVIYYGIVFYIAPLLGAQLTGIPDLSFFGLGSFNLYVWPPSIPFIAFSYIATVVFGVCIGLVGSFLSTSKYIQ